VGKSVKQLLLIYIYMVWVVGINSEYAVNVQNSLEKNHFLRSHAILYLTFTAYLEYSRIFFFTYMYMVGSVGNRR
jgi:hypothetical protein